RSGSFLKSGACSSLLSSGSHASSASSVRSERLWGGPRGPAGGQAGRKHLWFAGDQSQSQQAIRGCDARQSAWLGSLVSFVPGLFSAQTPANQRRSKTEDENDDEDED